ncbi:MAG TPA: hypothetical protein VFZ72_15370 [Jiangellaceae bacterium]
MTASVVALATLFAVPTETDRSPWPVRAVTWVVALEALALLAFSGWLLLRRVNETPSNEQVFEGSAFYLLLCGLLVGIIALGLRSRRGWAYGAAVVVQLIGLGIAYEMVQAGFWVGVAAVVVAAAAVLAGLFSAPARAAFGRDPS